MVEVPFTPACHVIFEPVNTDYIEVAGLDPTVEVRVARQDRAGETACVGGLLEKAGNVRIANHQVAVQIKCRSVTAGAEFGI